MWVLSLVYADCIKVLEEFCPLGSKALGVELRLVRFGVQGQVFHPAFSEYLEQQLVELVSDRRIAEASAKCHPEVPASWASIPVCIAGRRLKKVSLSHVQQYRSRDNCRDYSSLRFRYLLCYRSMTVCVFWGV